MRKLYYGDNEQLRQKLMCSLLPKKHYVVFSKALKFYLELGMKLTKVHRAIRFEVKAMFVDNIKFNTDQRAVVGKVKCKRTFFKMINNAPNGKTIENVAKLMNIEVLPTWRRRVEWRKSPIASIFGCLTRT